MEVTAQKVDGVIVVWMECVTENIIWMLLHSTWRVVLCLEWSDYSELYVEDNAQHVESDNVVWMVFVSMNITWKLLHSM